MSDGAGKRPVITVDGLSGSGKTTLAKMLAAKLGFVHLNSGLLYRGMAWLAINAGISVSDAGALVALLGAHKLELEKSAQGASMLLIDGIDRTGELQEPKISEFTSQLSTHREVRSALLPFQRGAFQGLGLVAEGRDMGTVVFPLAPLKFFIQVPESVRIQRRMQQLYGNKGAPPHGEDSSPSEVLRKNIEIEIQARDRRDQGRTESPAIAAPDAVIIDNSAKTLTLVLESMYSAVLQRGLASQ